MKHRRYHMRVSDAVSVDQVESLFGIPSVHHDDPDARDEGRNDIDEQGRGVVSRAGYECSVQSGTIAVQTVFALWHFRQAIPAEHTFWSASGPRGVEHTCTERWIGDVVAAERLNGLVVRLETWDVTAHRKCQTNTGCMSQGLDRHLTQRGIGDECLGITVVDDVANLFSLEVVVDGCESQAAAHRRCQDLDKLRSVLGDDGDRVTGNESAFAQTANQSIGVGVQTTERSIPVIRQHGGDGRKSCGLPGDGHPGLNRGFETE